MSTTNGRTYYATWSGHTRKVLVNDEGVVLDGDAVDAEITTLPGSDRQHLRFGGRSVSLFARREGSEWIVELEGRRFEVRVEDERTRHIRELASHVAPVQTKRELRAPMPGLIVRVDVEVGQDVEPGTGLIVMEAMKLENELKAEAAGTITSIAVAKGQAVERNALLLTLEAR